MHSPFSLWFEPSWDMPTKVDSNQLSELFEVDMGGSGDFISIGFLTKRFLAIR
jgi:hypothetical protein